MPVDRLAGLKDRDGRERTNTGSEIPSSRYPQSTSRQRTNTDNRSVRSDNSRGRRPSVKQYEGSRPEQPGDLERGERRTQGFLRIIDNIREDIKLIQENSAEILKLHKKAQTTLYVDEAERIHRSIEQISENTMKVSFKIRRQLKKMSEENMQMGETKSADKGDIRMRSNQLSQVTKQFMNTMTEFQQVQSKIKDKQQTQIKKEYKRLNPNATPQELEMVADARSSIIFDEQAMRQLSTGDSKRLYNEIQNRHYEIEQLEKSLLEIHQLFTDLSMIIDQQGDLVNNIEMQVDQAYDYTDKAVVELKGAVEHQKSNRKKRWMLIGCCLVLLAIVGFLIWFYVVRPSMSSSSSSSSNNKN